MFRIPDLRGIREKNGHVSAGERAWVYIKRSAWPHGASSYEDSCLRTITAMKIFICLFACVALVLASPLVKRQAGFGTYNLPDGSELIVGNVRSTFNCAGRPYGYYADPDNDCRIFHVCVPVVDEVNIVVDTFAYNFMCGNLTVFDQQNLICAHETDALPCNQAASFYDETNRNFGVTDFPRKR